MEAGTEEARFPKGVKALLEVGLMFLAAIPAFLWLWPAVSGTSWFWPTHVAAYAYMLVGCVVIGRGRWDWADLGFNRRGIVLSLACGTVFLASRIMVTLAVDWPTGRQPLNTGRLIGEVLFYFGAVGLVEELLFRGLIYRALEEWGGVRWAIWGSSLAFGLYHLAGQGPLAGLGTFIIGIVLALIRWRAGGIVGLIIVHGLIDVVGVEMLPPGYAAVLPAPAIADRGLLLGGTILLVAVPLYLWKVHPLLDRRHVEDSQDPGNG